MSQDPPLSQDRIDRSFFARPVLEVAPDALGGVLRRTDEEGTVAIRLTEVEAYDGRVDPASHSYRGQTARNATMFGPPGHLYCYFIYGLHHSLNMVCDAPGAPTGLLLRAGEVVEGAGLATERRSARRATPAPHRDLARGPGNVAQCFGADLADDGADLFGGEWDFAPVRPRPAHTTGPRVGVSGPGADPAAFPWRFWIPGEPTVSRFVAGKART
ncbi:DNA-3-methyladenine glycosylase [Brevibacterium sp. 5221]|uniref:Putative 3-methyladenine DNA glycosylase n=1 Tax=Brevibacterium rongguiense TaxID=2695267 RepID=A0A6N9HAD9_9MICO|nr:MULTISPECIES: DNA-3-methyladenine glycosylase [Brevibacterium]MYM20512.1 DNA-3-methyladenine glycosylase [Brevibacterium rongguiense]WAL41004.1 DNA-3-methyladenine glycosylase [Brevibacterium sp. BRM-1]